MARDRKRAKQRAQRRGAARPSGVPGQDQPGAGQLTRADLPGSLEHVGDVDEFDAALVRGAEGVPLAGGLPAEADVAESAPVGSEEPSGNGAGNGLATKPGTGARPTRVPARSSQSLPKRAVAFLRSSWAELQRVQWPDRTQVTQATAVVLGFVAVAGIYFGVADYVAKEIVEAIL